MLLSAVFATGWTWKALAGASHDMSIDSGSTYMVAGMISSYGTGTETETPGDLDIADDDTLYIREFVLALDVIEREPVKVVTSYTMSDARAWCFARIYNSRGIRDVVFQWYYEGEPYFEMKSKIGNSANWRVYSSVGLQPGSWRVVLEDDNGEELDEIEFLVSE